MTAQLKQRLSFVLIVNCLRLELNSLLVEGARWLELSSFMEAYFHSASDDDGPPRYHGTALHSMNVCTCKRINPTEQSGNEKKYYFKTFYLQYIHIYSFRAFFIFILAFFLNFTRLVVSSFDPLCKYLI